MLKLCTACREEKPLTDFHRRGTNGYQHVCKPCAIAARITYYKNNRQAETARNKERERKYAEWRRAFKDKPCLDCGKQFHFSAMQWDHRPGTQKVFDVSAATSKKRFLAEIAKCDLVCANCHAHRTWSRMCAKLSAS